MNASPTIYCSSCGVHIGARVQCPLPWCPSHKEAAERIKARKTMRSMVARALDDVETALDERDWDTARTMLDQVQTAAADRAFRDAVDDDRLERLWGRLRAEWPDAADGVVWWFGPEPWGAWICLNGKRVDIPVGARCNLTGRIIAAGDRGFVTLHHGEHSTGRRPILFDAMMSSIGVVEG